MWWHLHYHCWSWLWLLNATYWEVPVVVMQIVVLSEFIDTSNFHNSSICNKWFAKFNFVASKIAVSDELLSWLVHVERLWQSLSPKINGERVSAVVREVHFSDFNSVICEEVMPFELEISAPRVESKNFSIVVEELFL